MEVKMAITEITDISAPELFPYRNTSERALSRYHAKEGGAFIAESPKVIRTALESGYTPLSILAEKKCIAGQGRDIADRCGDIPIYTAGNAVLEQLTGFRFTQGMLAVMRRKPLPELKDVLAGTYRIALLENIMNQTNIGAVFRSAAALGFDAVLLTGGCVDPLSRRSVRVSMGTALMLPWTYIGGGSPDYIRALKEEGFVTAAMALRGDTAPIDDPRLVSAERLAVVIGTEGTGLLDSTIEACDYTVKIPMYRGVDSLNAAAASAVAFYQLRKRSPDGK